MAEIWKATRHRCSREPTSHCRYACPMTPERRSTEELTAVILLLMGRQPTGKTKDRFQAYIAEFKVLPPFRTRVDPDLTAQDYYAAHVWHLAEWLPGWFTSQIGKDAVAPQEQRLALSVLREAAKRTQAERQTFAETCRVHGFNKVNGNQALQNLAAKLASSLLADSVADTDQGELPIDPVSAKAYFEALAEHCGATPAWFPRGLEFSQIQQEVLVTPPTPGETPGTHDDADGLSGPAPQQNRSRPLPLVTALRQYKAVLLLGGPGSGKSWATKGRCLALGAEWRDGPNAGPIPVLVVAPRLEEKLVHQAAGSRSNLPELLAESMPEELATQPALVSFVAELLRSGTNVELLVDGYDEITSPRPEVGLTLESILALLDDSSRLIMTTRPSALPRHQTAKLMATLELQPFTEREQLNFIDTWFGHRNNKASSVKRWVRKSKLDLLSTPLLIALLCAVTSRDDDAPPSSEPELMHRVLTRLASNEDRFDEQPKTDSLVQRRIEVLERLSLSFVSDDRLLDTAGSTDLEVEHGGGNAWVGLLSLTGKISALDDLVATGLIQRVAYGHDIGVKFLHSAIRDYLIARALWRDGSWRSFLPRIWSQPECEPAISYLAALLPEPDELILSLERRFDVDPLNSARFVAGRAITLAGNRLTDDRRRRTRSELIILLGSNDPIDRNRSALLLSAMQDVETAQMLQSLINPLVPTRLVEAALRSVAGRVSQESLDVISECAQDDRFTVGERETAIEALADLGSSRALQALEQIARDNDGTPSVRAAAAFAALRRMNKPRAAASLLATDGDEAKEARWRLAERVGMQAESLGDFLTSLEPRAACVPDPYCRAVMKPSTIDSRQDFPTLASALRANPTSDLLFNVVETLREASADDPLAVVTARFILNGTEHPFLRALVASKVAAQPKPAINFWRDLISDLSLETAAELAAFLIRESDVLPPPCGPMLHAAIVEGELGAVPREVASRAVPPPTDAGGGSKSRVGRDDQSAPADASLADILRDGTRGGLIVYQRLRGLHRDIPREGPIFAAASSITHAVAAVGATAWVDALPSVAAVLEQRLALSRHHEAGYELAKLRAAWPRRQHEVESTIETYDASILGSRALASLLDDNYVDAAAMALASIGAHAANNELPNEIVTRILFAAGTLSHRGNESYRQASNYRDQFQQNRQPATLLLAWLHLAAGAYPEVIDTLDGFQPRAFQSEAEAAVLRHVANGGSLEGVAALLSWSAAGTARVLASAVRWFASTDALQQRIDEVTDALQQRIEELAGRWPDAALHSPGSHGRPPWQRELAAIAAKLLTQGEYVAAVAVFDVALKRRPTDPELINNHGFAIMPEDPETALAQLEKAAASYSVPFAVNVANRMLLKFLSGDYHDVLTIGDSYRTHGTREAAGGTSWLWDIDNSKSLTTVKNIYRYISELASRSARMLGDFETVERWAVWEQEMSGDQATEAADGGANE